MTAVRVRRLTAADWRVWREVRLAALADSPRQFGSTLAREQAFTEADWRARAQGTFLAEGPDPAAGPDVVAPDVVAAGVVGWYWTDEPRVADLVAMWVAPHARRRGTGAALVQAVVDDVVVGRGAELHLGVVRDNLAAHRLYRRTGFVDTGTETGEHSGDLLVRMRYQPERNAPA